MSQGKIEPKIQNVVCLEQKPTSKCFIHQENKKNLLLLNLIQQTVCCLWFQSGLALNRL